ncbi:MAG: glycosyltransferase, partial [Planctomycetota bacterium]
MALRNLLLVAYHFPPIGGSGVQRAVKLARHLPAAGWRANILTAGHAHYPLIDHSMVDAAGPAARVLRCRGLEPGAVAAAVCGHLRPRDGMPRWLHALEDRLYWRLDRICSLLKLPERELLWTPRAAWKGRQLIRRQRIEAVVTTSPPVASHLVGLSLKRRLGIPWVADLRDPMLDNFAYAPMALWADRFTGWLERTVLREADHCVVTCPELADRLQDRYPELTTDRVSTITNGYDPADAPDSTVCRGRGRFTLAYVGAFYRQQSIAPVLEAIRSLRASRSDIASLLEFRVVGSIAASQLSFVRDADRVFFRHIGYAEHRQAVEEMAAADAVLLTTPNNDGGRLCIPAKT